MARKRTPRKHLKSVRQQPRRKTPQRVKRGVKSRSAVPVRGRGKPRRARIEPKAPTLADLREMSGAQQRAAYVRQRRSDNAKAQAVRTIREHKHRASEARAAFKPKPGDKGKMVLISTDGKRNPQARGKKGYLVYVTKTGKKWLIREKGEIPVPHKISQIKTPIRRLKKASRDFQRRRLLTIERHRMPARTVIKGQGEINGEREMVKRLAQSITRTAMRQAGNRNFLITVLVRVTMPDGTPRVFRAEIPFGRRDHVTVKVGGVINFVRHKVWAFIAFELDAEGLVSRESANHIRRAARNKGLPREDWTDFRGEPWAGADLSTVTITHVEWKIEQMNGLHES